MPPRVRLETIGAEELAGLARLDRGEMTVAEYKDQFKRSFEVLKRLLGEYRAQQVAPDIDIVNGLSGVLSGDVLDEIGFDDGVWLGLEKWAEIVERFDTELKSVDRALTDTEPVLIAWMSDLHLGHAKCQYRKIRQDCETLRNTPGMYVILGGDLIDNVVTGVSGRGMHHEQLTTIDIQKYLAEELTDYLGADKVLAMLLGNHDEWSRKSDDFDPIAYLAKHIGCPYLGAFGTVKVSVGDESYSILCAHQFRMRSSFNLTHSTKRFWDFLGHSEDDAVMMGHTHEAASETAPKQRRYMFFGQAGSYLRTSRYGQRLGFGDSLPLMPGILVWPDEHRVLGIHDVFCDGPWMLKAARAEYRKRKTATRGG